MALNSSVAELIIIIEVVFHIFPLLFTASDWLKVNHLSQAEQKAESGFLNILSRDNSLRGDNYNLSLKCSRWRARWRGFAPRVFLFLPKIT